MSVKGYLSEFSLPEIFRFLDRARKTGLLTVRTRSASTTQKSTTYYIWLERGRIVAAANRLDKKELLELMIQKGWLRDCAIANLSQISCTDLPLGLSLKLQGILNAEQLKLLFQTQIIEQAQVWLQLNSGVFAFDPKASLPFSEMTGLSLPATELTLMGLRRLDVWTSLVDQLPDPANAVVSIVSGQPRYQLDPLEWQVWEFASGTVSLEVIAQQLRLPVEKVQQVVFRLVAAGLAEEIALMAPANSTAESENLLELTNPGPQDLSIAFLQNLLDFLRNQG